MSHPIHPLASWQSAVFLLNSRTTLFIVTNVGLREQVTLPCWHPFSRSYGANLPSSLTWFLSRTLVYSTLLPVSVCGTVTLLSTFRRFSRQQSPLNPFYPKVQRPIRSQAMCETDLPISRPTSLDWHFQSPAQLSYCVPPSLQ